MIIRITWTVWRLNLKIHPTSLNSNQGITKLEDVTKAYFERAVWKFSTMW